MKVSLPSPAPGLTPSLPDTKTVPEVQTPMEGGASSRESRKKASTNGPEVLWEELSRPPVDTPPPLKRGQHTKQTPAHLQGFTYDCVLSSKYISPAGYDTMKPSIGCGSCERHIKLTFARAEPRVKLIRRVKRLVHVPQPRYSAFSCVNAVESRRTKDSS